MMQGWLRHDAQTSQFRLALTPFLQNLLVNVFDWLAAGPLPAPAPLSFPLCSLSPGRAAALLTVGSWVVLLILISGNFHSCFWLIYWWLLLLLLLLVLSSSLEFSTCTTKVTDLDQD
jgi:hypothetical protein